MLTDWQGKPIFASDRPYDVTWVEQWGERNHCRGLLDIEGEVLYVFSSYGNTHTSAMKHLGLRYTDDDFILFRRYAKVAGSSIPIRLNKIGEHYRLEPEAERMVLNIASMLR